MRNATTVAVLAFSVLSSLSHASPVVAKPKPTCKPVTLNFDELGDSQGMSQDLPGHGYDYKGFDLVSSQWGWVSKGDQANGDWTADDRDVPDDGYQHTDVTTHSGNNAIMPRADGFAYQMDGANVGTGMHYYDLQSLWVRPEYDGAFNFRLECRSYADQTNANITVKVPAMPHGKFYQVKLPAKFQRAWRCQIGALELQQVIIDDIKVCQWYWNYSKSNVPPFVKG